MTRKAASGREPRPAGIRAGRDHQVVSLQRFVLADGHGAAELERELGLLMSSQHGSKGLHCQAALRSLDRPGGYLLGGCWQSPENLFDSLHTDAVGARWDRIGRLAAVEPGQAVAVGRMEVGLALTEATHALLVRAVLAGSSAAFEVQFGEMVGRFLYDPGFGGGLLLRSTVDPRTYHGLVWWGSAQSCEDAARGDHLLQGRRQLDRLTSRLTVERAEFVREVA